MINEEDLNRYKRDILLFVDQQIEEHEKKPDDRLKILISFKRILISINEKNMKENLKHLSHMCADYDIDDKICDELYTLKQKD